MLRFGATPLSLNGANRPIHVKVAADFSTPNLEPFIDWLRDEASAIPIRHRTPFLHPASVRSQTV
jgi:hypothetical protein